jgi:hypothetical protein
MTTQFSPDGKFWWNGQRWMPVADNPGAQWNRPVDALPDGRWGRGLTLAKISWSVLRSDKELLVLPVLSFLGLVASVLLIMGVGGLGLHAYATSNRPVLYVLGFLQYVVAAFVTYFFNAALVGAASLRLQGSRGSVTDGLRMAFAKIGQIFAWAVVSATVGQLIRLVQQRLGLLGQILGAIAGVAWAITTFFVVPVIVFEDRGTVDSIKRSAEVIRQRWGEGLVGNGAIGLVLFLLVLPALAICAGLAVVSLPLGIVLGVLVIAVYAAVGSAMSGIFRAALYQFAVSGRPVGAFSADLLSSSFRRK